MLITQQITERILSKQPMSLIRYGDGEAMILNGLKDESAFVRVLKRQLGLCPSLEDALKIRENLITALSGCDILGLPFGKKKDNPEDYWYRAIEILDRFVPERTDQECHIDVAYDLADEYANIFKHFDQVNYISCRELNFKKHFRYVNHFQIAPEMHFTSYEGPRHYPDQFVKIKKWIESVMEPGTLCLVGAGVVGKIYCNWFRDCGGVALDIGSVFDRWSGHVTRGPERARDKKGEPTFEHLQ